MGEEGILLYVTPCCAVGKPLAADGKTQSTSWLKKIQID
jgi:hypothetical protein